MAQSNKQQDFSTMYNNKLTFLQQWYQERVSFLSTFKLPGLSLDDLEKEIEDLKSSVSNATSGSGSAAGQISGNGPEEQTWNYFASQSFSPASIAGIMGNLKVESGINPSRTQDGGGPGRGIAQWEIGSSRYNALVKLASSQGKQWDDIGIQLQFLYSEMQGGDSTTKYYFDTKFGGLDSFKKLTDPKVAADQFEQAFERAGKPNLSTREQYAQDYFDKWGKNPPASGIATAKGDAGKVISEATSWLTKPNVYWFGGGRTQSDIAAGKFDCSSWVRYVFAQCGYDVMGNAPRLDGTTFTIRDNPSLIQLSSSQIQPGDIIFWDTYTSYGHVGIYLGNDRAIGDNGNTGTGHVAYIDMTNSYWKPRLEAQARRVKWNA